MQPIDNSEDAQSAIIPTQASRPQLNFVTPSMFEEQTIALQTNRTKKFGQDNTALAYDSKIIEFRQYCGKVWCHEDSNRREYVTEDKVYGFMLYNAFQEKVSSRKRKKRGNENILRFDIDNYKKVREEYSPQLFLMLQ